MFKAYEDEEYLQFSRVGNKRSSRPDVHAFILLDELVPAPARPALDELVPIICNMVLASKDDELYLSVEVEQLNGVDPEAIKELLRCGVWYNEEADFLVCFAGAADE